MHTNELKKHIAAILVTALETEPAIFPETTAYLGMGGDDQAWYAVRNVMVDSGMITLKGNLIKLTEPGRALARKINALQKAAAKAREAAEATHHPHDFESYREECKARFAKMATPGQVATLIAACNAERDRQTTEIAPA